MKKAIILFASAAACLQLSAQNLNPEVQVTGDYAVRMAETAKNSTRMDVPDSLFKFDYKFDYSVFDSPYFGSYEFTPYSIQITPTTVRDKSRKLYVSAGAGFTPRPELELVYAPIQKENFVLTVFNDGKGYWGPYREIDRYFADTGDKYWGYDFSDRLGVEGRAATSIGDVVFQLAGDGIFVSDIYTASNYLSGVASGRVASNSSTGGFFLYDAGLKYRFGFDALLGGASVAEHNFVLDASVGPDLMEDYGFFLDFALEYDGCSGMIDAGSARMRITPRVDMEFGPVALELGACLAYSDKMSLYPAVEASVRLFKDYLKIYADVKGGECFNSYSRFKFANHFFDPSYCGLEISRELLNAGLGFRGHFANAFQYDLKGGYSINRNVPLFLANTLNQELMGYADYNCVYADATMAWCSDRIDADFGFSFRLTDLPEDSRYFNLPMFGARLHGLYNWSRRIYAGILAEYSSGCSAFAEGGMVKETLGPWVDLGLEGRYRFNDRWSVWMNAGNLLNQDIRRSPMHSAKGLNFTAGVALSL